MANCNDLFQDFHQNIRILSTKSKQMKKSKEALRDKIRTYFKENHPEYNPKFYTQGSGKMKNDIRYKDETADIDDGVYFEREPDVTPTTLQQWVYDAVEGHTDGGQQHRKKCIRVIFKKDYNIDLPVLCKWDGLLHPYIAVKNGKWDVEDDPKEFIEWFETRKDKDGQLLRIIKYLKAWGDHRKHSMPSGLCMTLLAEKNIVYDLRDDVCLKKTLENLKVSVDASWTCIMPTTPNDDLFADYDQTFQKNFKTSLNDFIADAKSAIDTADKSEASKLWRKHLSDRFPEYKKEESNIKGTAASLASVVGASKPWSE